LQWVSFLSYVRYAFEAVMQGIYGYDRAPLDCENKNSTEVHQCIFKDGEDLLKELDVYDAKFYIDFIVLCAFFVIIRIACYAVLRWRVKMH